MVFVNIKQTCPHCNTNTLFGTLEPNKVRCRVCKRIYLVEVKD